MKLRLRSLESKETLKIEVPNSCSIQQFKQLLSRSIPLISPSSIHLSLNRTDEIQVSSPDESLQSLGIMSGDLIFYTVDPSSMSRSSETLASSSSVQEHPPKNESFTTPTVSTEVEMADASLGSDVMNTFDDGSFRSMDKRNPEPYFIKRVLNEEISRDQDDQNMLVLGIHVVLLDSGFVLCDGVSRLQVAGNRLPKQWASDASALSLWYALPEILSDASTVKDAVVLKFVKLGNVVMIYGSLSDGGSGVHMVRLDKCKFAKTVGSMIARCSSSSDSVHNGESRDETGFFNFWKIVKDGLVLPLLIDLCEKAGLESPPCFMRLPTELKVKILEYLAGIEITKMACVCSEMQYLASNNDLWRQKFEEEFGGGQGAKDVSYWKELFAGHWDARKKAEKAIIVRPPIESPNLPSRPIRDPNPFPYPVIRDPDPFGIPVIRDPSPFGFPDRFPGSGLLRPFGQIGSTFPRMQPRRHFSPLCNLGGFNN